MNKADFVNAVAAEAELSKTDAANAVDAIIEDYFEVEPDERRGALAALVPISDNQRGGVSSAESKGEAQG